MIGNMRDMFRLCLELVEISPAPDFWSSRDARIQLWVSERPLHTTVIQYEANPPPSLLTSTECSFQAERGNIWTPCLWEGWRPEHDVLKSLPWLPTCSGIDLKVLLLVFKCLNGFRSSFLSDLLLPCQPSQMLRSSGAGLWFSPQLEAKLRLMLHSALLTHLYGASGPFVCAKYNFIC